MARDGRWVVLDVGETLIQETRIWSAWAAELGVPPMTLMSTFGAIVERGLQYHHVFEFFPVRDWPRVRDAVEQRIGGFQPEDLYPDALVALERLRERHRIAVLGNQPARRTAQLRALGVEAEVIAMSDELGVAKPEAAFFEATLRMLGGPDPGEVAYVGDRIDNDVLPAHAAGMRAIWLRQGPWGVIPREIPPEAHLVVGSLSELAERIEEAWA